MKKVMRININKKYLVFLGIFLILSVISLLFTHIGQDVVYKGDDFHFHLNRIEGIAEGMSRGDFFPKINYAFLSGIGYGTPLFYSDFFLYPAGLFKYLGLSMANSYILLLFLINVATYLIAYHSFLLYKKVDHQAFIFAVLYGSASYRLSDLTERAALGELLAMTFLPLVFVGLWSIFNAEKDRFYLLALGMFCLLMCHLITAFMFSIFIFLYILANMKTLLSDQKIILRLIKAVLLTVLLSLGFLLPMAEQVRDQSFMFQTYHPAMLSLKAGSVMDYLKTAVRNSGYNNIGLLTLLLFIFMLVSFRELSKASRKLLVLSGLFLFMSTNLMPYQLLEKTLLNSIQFPWRFFAIVTLGVYWLFADNVEDLLKGALAKKIAYYGSITAAVVLMFLHGMFIYETGKYIPREEVESIGFAIGMGQEYIPSDADIYDLVSYEYTVINSKNMSIENVEVEYGHVDLDYQVNDPDEAGTLILPFINYKGYQATVDGEAVEVKKSALLPGFCEVDVVGSGHLAFGYQWTKIQVVSLCLSIAGFAGLFYQLVLSRKVLLLLKKRQGAQEKNSQTGILDK